MFLACRASRHSQAYSAPLSAERWREPATQRPNRHVDDMDAVSSCRLVPGIRSSPPRGPCRGPACRRSRSCPRVLVSSEHGPGAPWPGEGVAHEVRDRRRTDATPAARPVAHAAGGRRIGFDSGSANLMRERRGPGSSVPHRRPACVRRGAPRRAALRARHTGCRCRWSARTCCSGCTAPRARVRPGTC